MSIFSTSASSPNRAGITVFGPNPSNASYRIDAYTNTGTLDAQIDDRFIDVFSYSTMSKFNGADFVVGTADTGASGGFNTVIFDASTEEYAVYQDSVKRNYGNARFNVLLNWICDGPANGNVLWDVQLKALNSGEATSESYSTATQFLASPTASGEMQNTEFYLSSDTMSGVTAGDAFLMKVTRKAADATDTSTGEAELYTIEVK